MERDNRLKREGEREGEREKERERKRVWNAAVTLFMLFFFRCF